MRGKFKKGVDLNRVLRVLKRRKEPTKPITIQYQPRHGMIDALIKEPQPGESEIDFEIRKTLCNPIINGQIN